MKTLYLIRHAKSSKELNIADIDRPLNERGYNDSELIGKKLLQEKIKPDLLISSPAIRAFSTALIIARNLEYAEDRIVLNKNLYETSAKDYANEISKTNDSINCIFVFGHNPTISEASEFFLKKNFEEMPTCGVIGLTFKTNKWSDVLSIPASLSLHLFPSSLKTM